MGRFPAVVEVITLDKSKPTIYFKRPNQGSQITSAAFLQDEHLLLTGGGDGIVRVWEIDQPIHPLEWKLDSGVAIQQITTSPDGLWLAIASGKEVFLYDQKTLLEGIQQSFLQGNPKPKIKYQWVELPTD